MLPIFILPLGMAFLFIRFPMYVGVAIASAILGYTGAKHGFTSMEFMSYLLCGVLPGFIVAFSVIRKKTLFVATVLAIIPEVVFQALLGAVPTYMEVYRKVLNDAAVSAANLFNLPELTDTMVDLQWRFLVPFGEILKSTVYIVVLNMIFSRFAYGQKQRLSGYSMPFQAVLAFALSLCVAILFGGSRSSNLPLCAMVSLYLINGVSIVRLFFEQKGRSKIGEALFFAMQVWLLFIPLFFLGLFEHWLNMRDKVLAGAEES